MKYRLPPEPIPEKEIIGEERGISYFRISNVNQFKKSCFQIPKFPASIIGAEGR